MNGVANVRREFLTWILLAAAAGAVGCGGTTSSSEAENGPKQPPAAPIPSVDPPVAAAEPASGILSVLSVEHQVDVSSERDGVVVSIAKDEGSAVKSGEMLGQLDDRSLQMELVKARDDLQVAQNNVKYKEAELKAKTAAFHRQQQLRALGLSSDADLEAAEFEAKGAEYDLHGWQALVESNQAEIHRIEIQIDQTRLRAPFSGVVVHRYVREGQALSKGDKCFRVSQLSPLQVQFQVPESHSPRPTHGADVEVELVGDPGHPLSARVVKVSPTVDPASDSYNVTAQLSDAPHSDLRPGMAVRVRWPAGPSGTSK